MRVFTDLDFQLRDTAVCIGKFDGIHRGHRMLIEKGKETGQTMVMLSFLFDGTDSLYSFEEKRWLAEKLGIDVLIACAVDEEFRLMEPIPFIRQILVDKCDAQTVVVGSDFRFGYRRSGDAALLQREGRRLGMKVNVMDKLTWKREIISSTRIREALTDGRVRLASEMLKTPYFIMGEVQHGNELGRKMSVPTANIIPSAGKVLPPFGVYAVRVEVSGQFYDGVGNLGVKPTVSGEGNVGLEVWLFDFWGDLYGETIRVYLMEFQRPERKFDSVDALRQQIARDTEQAKEILSRPECGFLW